MLPIILISIIYGSFILSVCLTWVTRSFAFRWKIVDEPVGGRKIHHERTALFGGLAIGATIIAALAVLLPYFRDTDVRQVQIIGVMIGIGILMIGGALDDYVDLSPWVRILFSIGAAITVVSTGSGILQVTNPAGHGAISLVWMQIRLPWGGILSLPSDVISVAWLLIVTYAMKILDGLDGLATGLTMIGALMIAGLATSAAYSQPMIAIIALVIAAAHLGFLPFNRSGSIFLGEAGSTIAGFSLAALSIISGAKVATAAAALGVPLVDMMLVIVGRMIRRVSIFKGDTTHLHFRLLQAGLSPKNAVRFIWGISIAFGLIALTLQTRGKIFLLVGLAGCVFAVSTWAYSVGKRKGNKT
jgi:UDP-GlcNAc:undecaprenyl-phosphate/decaprenyl-phosphate GlcNAc-1-phosphate transferase